MTAELEQAMRGHVGRLAAEIGERLALQRGEPPVFVLHPIWHWTRRQKSMRHVRRV